ncbi:MAG: MazF family transcriptional regulator [Gammaproteobacteria bacterium]|nr:MazF family transcriptional regulator [Gammaproteobacteria bacterium]
MTTYIPERNEIIWLDFEPTNGKVIGKYRSALVLSSQSYNRQTGLLICCPVSTSIRGGVTEIPVNNLNEPSVVAASLVQTLSWKDRKAKHIVDADHDMMEQVLVRIISLLGIDKILSKYI